MTAPAMHNVLPYQIAEDTFLITWGWTPHRSVTSPCTRC